MATANGLYEIEEILGSDEFAVLCNARERGELEGRPVTLKVVRQDVTDESLLERVQDEARMLGRLNHPSIVHVYRLLTYNGRPVVETEVLRGLSAMDLIVRNPSGLPLDDSVKIARRVILALEAAYTRPDGPDGKPMRIIHRNLQPPAVFISTDGDVKVMDFILAKGHFPDRRAVSFELTPAMQRFTAPEIGMVRVTSAVDIYAVGGLLFELLTGQTVAVPPAPEFHDEMVDERVDVIMPECVSPVAVHRLRDLVRVMLRFEPELRPNYREVAEVLEDILDVNEAPHGLGGFARRNVRTAWEARMRVDPSVHEDFDEVAFLETDTPDVSNLPGAKMDKGQVERAIWNILADLGWHYRLGEIKDLVISSGHRPLAPFLAVLDRVDVPQWRFWRKEATAEDILGVLAIFAQSPEPEIVERAGKLMDHPDPGVVRAAKHIVAQSKA